MTPDEQSTIARNIAEQASAMILETHNTRARWLQVTASIGTIAVTLLGVFGVIGMLRSAHGAEARFIVAPVMDSLRAERQERVAADVAETAAQARQERFIELNTERLDAIGLVLTTPPSSQAHANASADLERLRQRRLRLNDTNP